MWWFLCFLFVIFNVKCQTWQENRPTVYIKQGMVEGISVRTDSGKMVNSFLGIPYALPPKDDLRFLPPQRHFGWNGSYQAKSFGSKCPQLPIRPGSHDNEDCLFLNIWIPMIQGKFAQLLPVIVFFEGIDFYKSSDLPLSGQDLATEGVIVVTVNYRLNVFGFFCLETQKYRGNLGLLDQYFALIWVRENIKQFGGDPEKITLFGHLSGAASVTLHLISPRTAGLFQRAIISSGSAVSPWQTTNNPITATKEVMRILGCNSYITNQITCFKTKSVEEILRALHEYSMSNNFCDMFLPVVDSFLPENNRYLPLEPDKALKDGTYLQVPILTGVTKPIVFSELEQWLELASQGFVQLQQYIERAKIPEIIRLYKFTGSSKDQMFELIKWKYESSSQGDVRILFEQLKKLEYESKIEAPHFLQLSYLASSYVQPIFVYYIDDIGMVLNITDPLASTDLLLLFGPMLLKQSGRSRFNSNELRLSEHIKKMWIDFVKFGNPTPQDNRINIWRKYSTEDPYIEQFRTINAQGDNEGNARYDRINFWNNLLPKLFNIRSSVGNNIPRELQSSPDPAAGFRHAMYTLVGLVIALLGLLTICIFLLKKFSKQRERRLHLEY